MSSYVSRFRHWCSPTLCCLLLLVTAGCRQAPTSTLISNDFENLVGWTSPLPSWLTSARAHSGQYAAVVTPASAFAATYQNSWENLDSPRKLRLRTWTWLPNARVRVALVLEVARPNEQLYYKLLWVHENVRRYEQWEPVERDFSLPAGLLPTDQIKFYVWQTGPVWDTIYFDDLSLEKIR